MKNLKILLLLFLVALLTIGAECDLLSFNKQPLKVTVKVEKEFEINSSSTSFSEFESINLQQELVDAGIPVDKIDDVTVKDVSFEITSNSTPNSVILNSASLVMSLNADFNPAQLILNYMIPVPLNTLLNIILSPLYDNVSVAQDGIDQLTGYLNQNPLPTVYFRVNGVTTGSPVIFSGKATIEVQVEYTP